MQSPPGSTVEYTSEQLRSVEKYLRDDSRGGCLQRSSRFPDGGLWQCHPASEAVEERTRKQQDIARELNQKFQSLPGVSALRSTPPSLGQSGRSLPVEYVIMWQMPYADLDRIVQQFIAEISKPEC